MRVRHTILSLTAGKRHHGPIPLVLASALMWGLFWVPIRVSESLGLAGLWANTAINLGAFISVAAVALLLKRPSAPKGANMGLMRLGAVFIGIAVAFYGVSLALTEVAKAVLLFYLAPAWSTLIEVMFLGRRWHWRRLPPLLLSFSGMIVVFRGEIPFDHGGFGDLIALLSGMAWSAGAALVFTSDDQEDSPPMQDLWRLASMVMLSALITAAITLPLDWQRMPTLDEGDVGLALLLALIAGAAYLAPIIVITLWGAMLLLPATISFLLAAEILSGVTTSAIFLDEPYGFWEFTGSLLIIGSIFAHIAVGEETPPRPR